MRPSPAEEWQRLTKLYSEMSDGQLVELAESFSDLTEFAQPILRDELKKRGLGDSTAVPGRSSVFSRWNNQPEAREPSALPDDEDLPRAYLCECEDGEQVQQLGEALRREGIVSFVESPHAVHGASEYIISRIFVPADQLAKARKIASRPIPQEIIDGSKENVEDFVAPRCPQCGASDPLLDSIDPVNTWRCDVCNATWSDPATADAIS